MVLTQELSLDPRVAGADGLGAAVTPQTVTNGDEMYLRMREVGSQAALPVRRTGGCSYTVANCNMLHCSFREKVNPEIRKALEAGIGARTRWSQR